MTTTSSKPKHQRRMARQPQAQSRTGGDATLVSEKSSAPTRERKVSKLDQVEAMLVGPSGASIAEMVAATGWQQHSIRGALAGSLKKRGLSITSEKIDGERRYRAEAPK